MSAGRNILMLCSCIILVAVLAAGCMTATTPTLPPGIKKFNSTSEIEQYLEESVANVEYGAIYRTMVPTVGINADSKAMAQSEQASGIPAPSVWGGGPGAGGVPYSQTNVQVAGVDEPDIIKNDNRYIYTISGQNLVIIDAYPAARASVISATEIADTPRDIFVRGDRLVLFSTGTPGADTYQEHSESRMIPAYYIPSPPVTHATIYDISNRAKPAVMKDYSIDGNYIE